MGRPIPTMGRTTPWTWVVDAVRRRKWLSTALVLPPLLTVHVSSCIKFLPPSSSSHEGLHVRTVSQNKPFSLKLILSRNLVTAAGKYDERSRSKKSQFLHISYLLQESDSEERRISVQLEESSSLSGSGCTGESSLNWGKWFVTETVSEKFTLSSCPNKEIKDFFLKKN